MNTISIANLSKNYGSFAAVSDFSADIAAGSVFGLLGPNGAGKTTTFKCMLGLAAPSSGTVTFEGKPLNPELFERLAYVPEKSVLYDWMTIGEHLEMQRRAFKRFDAARAQELLSLFDLNAKKRVKHLSKGMRTATALCMAFANNPDILVLDEPTSGLDPVNQRAVLKLIIDASAQGKTILFSSHQIGQVERAAESIAIMQKGRLLVGGSVDDLKAGWKIVEAIFDTDQFSTNGIANDPRIHRVERTGRILRLSVHQDSEAIASEVTAMGATNVRTLDLNLEDIFLNAVDPATDTVDLVEKA
ncbi:MAG: ABC transporter ATP-binding protein [Candidatus Eremiobacteraeota bacterium]|nr:ABC transporter ATP-binding protein [Candidatus Eremiobacteraeota bacterium]